MAVAFVKAHTVVTEKTLDTSASVTVDTGGIAAGNLIVLAILFDNAGTTLKPVISSITKQSGETATWANISAARSASTSIGAFASAELWAIKTTVAWTAGTYTVTLDTSVTQKAAAFLEFSGAEATQRSTAGTAYSTTTTAASATTTGTTPVIGDLALGFMFGSNVAGAGSFGDPDTTGGAWVFAPASGIGSTGGAAATNNFGSTQYKILTAASHQTYNGQFALTAGNGSIVAILQATPDPAITQAAYRLYADGTETGSTALAAQDTAATADLTSGDANLQVRVRLQETAGSPSLATTDDYQLQWRRGDEYGISKYLSTTVSIYDTRTQIAQSFLGPGGPLTSATFYLKRSNNPTGTVSAALWAHDGGTLGSTGLPTGSPLATSTNSFTASAFPNTAPPPPAVFTFDGTFTLTAGTPYFIGLVATGATNNVTGSVDAASGNTAPNAAGGQARFTTVWATFATYDLCFEIGTWTDVGSASSVVSGYGSSSLTDAAATTNRLTGGTGTFTAGKISEDGLADNLGWPGSNYTELLYSVTLKQADLANGHTLRFRVLRNGATTGFTYTQYPSITVSKVTTPTGSGTGTYDFTKTTATGYKSPQGSTTTGTYAWNRTTVTGTKLTKGTAVGAYAWDRTAATGVAPVLPKTGTAVGTYAFDKTAATGTKTPRGTTTTGTYLWASTSVTGVVEKRATTTGTYAFNRTTATGARASQGTTVGGTYTWTGNAQGLAPAVGVKAGNAIGAYLFARTTATGTKAPSGAATGAYAYAGTAAGTRPQRGTAAGSYAFDRTTATGTKTPRATAVGTYLWARTTATGTVVKSGSNTLGTYAFNRTAATGIKTPRGTSSGTYLYVGTAAGTKTPRATATTGTYAFDRTAAAGVRTPKATGTGTYNWSGTGTAYKLPLGSATTGTYNYSGTAQGIRPIPGVKQGTASGTYNWTGTGFGVKGTTRGTATGAYAYTGTAAGYKLPKATSTGTHLWAGTSTGKRTPQATSTGSYLWARTTATGKRTPKATATGGYLYTGTGQGVRPAVAPKQGSATGTYLWQRTTATGRRLPKATSTGTYLYNAAVTGVTPPIWGGTATGTYRWNRTTATGLVTRRGVAAGTYLYTGTATGAAAHYVVDFAGHPLQVWSDGTRYPVQLYERR